MFKTPPNQRSMTLRLKRRQVIDILLALDAIEEPPADGNKWQTLRDQIRAQLADFDKTLREA